MSLINRKASLEDVNQLVYLRKAQLVDEGNVEDKNIDNELTYFFSNGIKNETLFVWVAVDGNEIVGTSGVCFFQYPPTFSNETGMVAYITDVYTKREYRKQGIATKLLEHVMEDIVKRNCKSIRLHASTNARNLYSKIGFEDAEGVMVKVLQ